MIGDYIKVADWKSEKHVPVIECPQRATAGEPFSLSVAVGRGIPHPNEPGHHIAWIALHYVPDGASASIELARCDFSAHGASAADSAAPARTSPAIAAEVSLGASGRLVATAYCNLHGLWESERRVAVE